MINVFSVMLNASVYLYNNLAITSSSTLTVDGANLSVSGALAVFPGSNLVISNTSVVVSGMTLHSDHSPL